MFGFLPVLERRVDFAAPDLQAGPIDAGSRPCHQVVASGRENSSMYWGLKLVDDAREDKRLRERLGRDGRWRQARPLQKTNGRDDDVRHGRDVSNRSIAQSPDHQSIVRMSLFLSGRSLRQLAEVLADHRAIGSWRVICAREVQLVARRIRAFPEVELELTQRL